MRMCKEIIGEEKKELKRKKWYKLCRKVVLTRVFKLCILCKSNIVLVLIAAMHIQISFPRQLSITNSICHVERICIAIYTSTILLQCILWKGVQFLISTGKIPSLTDDEREEKKREMKKEKGIQALENDDGAAGSSTRTTIGLVSPASGKSVASGRGRERGRKKTEKTTPRSTSSGKKRKVRFEGEDGEKTSSPAALASSDEDDLPSTASERSCSSENSSDESSSTSDEDSTSSGVDSATGESKKKRKSKAKITNADGTSTSTDCRMMGLNEDEKLKSSETSQSTDHRDAGGSLGGTGNYMHMIGLDNVCRFRQALQRVMNKCELATGNYVSAYVKKLEEKFAKGEIAAAGDVCNAKASH